MVYKFVEAVTASWKDLELWLANPMIDIDGWPGVQTFNFFPDVKEF